MNYLEVRRESHTFAADAIAPWGCGSRHFEKGRLPKRYLRPYETRNFSTEDTATKRPREVYYTSSFPHMHSPWWPLWWSEFVYISLGRGLMALSILCEGNARPVWWDRREVQTLTSF